MRLAQRKRHNNSVQRAHAVTVNNHNRERRLRYNTLLERHGKENQMRKSIEPTYDSRETGPRFNVESRINHQIIGKQQIADPFVTHAVTIGFWDAVKAFLFDRKLRVEFRVDADIQIIEDVMELDANYLGANSTRRQQFNSLIESTLANM